MRSPARQRLILTGEALVPVTMVIAIVVAIAGVVQYMTGIENRVSSTESAAIETNARLSQMSRDVKEVLINSAATDAKLSIIYEIAKEHRRSDK